MKVTLLLSLMLTGCAAHRPLSPFVIENCAVTRTWVDEHGIERKRCECPHGIIYGYDAVTHMNLVHCQ